MSQTGYMLTLDQDIKAGVPIRIAIPGERVTLAESSAEIDVEFLDYSGSNLGDGAKGLNVGDGGGPGGMFYALVISSAVNQSIRLVITKGDFSINRVSGQVVIIPAADLSPAAPVNVLANSCSFILAPGTRKKVSVHLPATHPQACWIKGYAGTFAEGARGIPIFPGETHFIEDYTGALQLHNPDAAAVNVYVSEFI